VNAKFATGQEAQYRIQGMCEDKESIMGRKTIKLHTAKISNPISG